MLKIDGPSQNSTGLKIFAAESQVEIEETYLENLNEIPLDRYFNLALINGYNQTILGCFFNTLLSAKCTAIFCITISEKANIKLDFCRKSVLRTSHSG